MKVPRTQRPKRENQHKSSRRLNLVWQHRLATKGHALSTNWVWLKITEPRVTQGIVLGPIYQGANLLHVFEPLPIEVTRIHCLAGWAPFWLHRLKPSAVEPPAKKRISENQPSLLQQGSLHYTPEHCLVNGGFHLFWWEKQCFKWANVRIFSGALYNHNSFPRHRENAPKTGGRGARIQPPLPWPQIPKSTVRRAPRRLSVGRCDWKCLGERKALSYDVLGVRQWVGHEHQETRPLLGVLLGALGNCCLQPTWRCPQNSVAPSTSIERMPLFLTFTTPNKLGVFPVQLHSRIPVATSDPKG